MSTSKNINLICILITLSALIITILFMNGKKLGLVAIVDEDAEAYEGNAYFTANDLNGSWDSSEASVIELKGDEAVCKGSGCYAYDGGVYISNGGRYIVTGSLTDGSIVVDAYKSSKVFIMFDGVTINSADSAGFIVNEADKVFITLKEGTDNYISTGEEFSDEALNEGIDGAIFAHDDLTINGSGSLEISSGYKHGIVAKDDLVVTGGRINISAPADGMRANDSLRICSADIKVEAGDDALVINHEDGYFYIESGSLSLDSEDDAIHSAGDVTIAGGDILISAGDDGIHSDKAFLITDGKITINECYEGIEALTIDMEGGDITIYSEDDGFNANGGSNSFGMGGPAPGASMEGVREDQIKEESFKEDQAKEAAVNEDNEEEETYVRICGGELTIINDSGRDADGIDSNGDIIIEGGLIRVSLVNSGSNSALDYASESGGRALISGGNIIACGSCGMAEHFDSESTQASILYTYSEGAEAGTLVTLKDKEGNIVMEYQVPQSFSSINLSCPEIKLGESYVISIGDQVEEITLNEMSGSYGDSTGTGFQGSANMGGMMPRGDFDKQRGERDSVSGNKMQKEGEAMTVSGNGPAPGQGGRGPMEDGRMRMGGGSPPGQESEASAQVSEAEETVTKGKALSEYDAETFIWLAFSLLAISFAIIFSVKYKRRSDM
ncbi:MAG: carbohydrate-binding domain-containing protein [Lachnospiraceae bacterium]|nr:carbohydrate-binding domain-containing protein [Lachnospiraceae bacterium]